MKNFSLSIAVLAIINGILAITNGKLISSWENKKASWILLVIGMAALSIVVIIGYTAAKSQIVG